LPPSALSVVVSDAGPLIALGRLDLLALLPALFAQVQVPQAVLRECLALVLVQAKRAGHVAAIGPLIESLRAGGQRLSRTAVAEALAAAGEAAV
jgi:predicted nucleic acid-binding protein